MFHYKVLFFKKQDINECIVDTSAKCLTNNTICLNTHGSFECVCSHGLQNISNECVDIDECQLNLLNSCPKDSQCLNTFGSYKCECSSGLAWNSLTSKCDDVNECKDDESMKICGDHSTCLNTYGSYLCECESGWNITDLIYCSGYKKIFFINVKINFLKMNLKIQIKDVDECIDVATNKCHSKAKCFNLPGTYECKCIEGFEGDGFNCTDIDECQKNSASNGNSEDDEEEEERVCNEAYFKCVNTPGSFECVCKDGFVHGSSGDCIG